MSTKIVLKFSRSNRIYRPSEPVEGKIVINSLSSISHHGIRLSVNGSVSLQVRGGSAGVIESFYGIRALRLNRREILVQVQLSLIRATTEVIVESDKADVLERPVSPEMAIFYITPDTQRHPLLPEIKSGGFRVTGRISTLCSLLDPISGELTVETSAVPISSIDIHLLRVESVLIGEKIVTETSLIQTTQIADGDVCRNLTLPIYVILPRLLTCPSVFAGPFSIEFKVSIVISFQSELSKLHKKSDPRTPRLWLAMETLPLELVRTR
ncbi:VACUOLAR PROTEIN SORTING 26 RELATED [Salix viminalis]|uniref:VACUOLAR PROTEIN SORTING 26 RELATED n=1 Tax=Salix viminalis TaxID=40686 RepID=A0A9Q0NW85_SALVM|nr:VACUOLAR PROTEIN SORTING 26 RELATED [Salix viminalis]